MKQTEINRESTQNSRKRTVEDYEFVNHPQKQGDELGIGTYGSVKLVTEKGGSDQLYAMKIVSK